MCVGVSGFGQSPVDIPVSLGVIAYRGSLKPELMELMEPHLDIDAHFKRHGQIPGQRAPGGHRTDRPQDHRGHLRRLGVLGGRGNLVGSYSETGMSFLATNFT